MTIINADETGLQNILESYKPTQKQLKSRSKAVIALILHTNQGLRRASYKSGGLTGHCRPKESIRSLYQIFVKSNEKTTVDINKEVLNAIFEIKSTLNSIAITPKVFSKYIRQMPTTIIIKSRSLAVIWNV